MSEIETAVFVFVLMLASTALGAIVRPLLPEEHKARETVQLVQLVVGMLVTFAALVLGLLTASAKATFDTTNNDIRSYASALIQLDQSLREFGPPADNARRMLRAYTGAAIASTWPGEPPPAGDFYPRKITQQQPNGNLDSRALGQLLERAQLEVRRFDSTDTFHQKLAQDIVARFESLVALRWKLVEEAHGSIAYPFDRILVFWLLIIFLSFGLIAPRNALSLVTITLGAVSIATAVLVIVDLDTPFSGPIQIASAPMRDALGYLLR